MPPLNRIGIRKEDEHKRHEYRAPLVPSDLAKLRDQYSDAEFIIEAGRLASYEYPRAFTDEEYEAVGATIDDIAQADIILGIKEIPIADLLPNKMYAFFSHTYKAQPHNMPMLRKLRNIGCSLIDYELIVEDVSDDLYEVDRYRRKVFFGHMAGYAGTIDTLYGLGQRYAVKGIHTPFSAIKKAIDYTSDYGNFGDFDKAIAAIETLAEAIKTDGLPQHISPVIFGLTGHGNVGKAVRHILEKLPIVEITPEQLIDWRITPEESLHQVYLVHFSRAYREPATLQTYLPHLSALIHGAKWLPHQERMVTRAWLQHVADTKLEIIGDISCDPNGAIAISKPTYPDDPIYTYLPKKDDLALTWSDEQFEATCDMGIQAEGVAVMSVTNLPAAFARESSTSFSHMLVDSIAELIHADLTQPFADLAISRQVKRAFIMHQGEFTPDFEQLQNHVLPRVAIIGAGRMSETVIDYLVNHTSANLIIADSNLKQAEAVSQAIPAKRLKGIHQIEIGDTDEQNAPIEAILKSVDIVVSLLPAFLHPKIAKLAITTRTHLVTASYVSEAMQALHDEARAAGIILLNEVGVDPGLDHMSAMKIIHQLQAEGKQITSFKSYCGGIPYQTTRDNPLNFKASWSPIGILSAVNRPARFIHNQQVIDQAPLDVFKNAQSISIADAERDFEGYPNGNSEQYQAIYGLEQVQTLIRGTLRFSGWSHIFQTLHTLGWFSDAPSTTVAAKTLATDLSEDILAVVKWLKLNQAEDETVTAFEYLRDSFLNQEDLAYFEGESDQLVMFHEFEATDKDGQAEHITSELRIIGDADGYSAMAKTVGYPCAIAVKMILDGTYTQTGVSIPTIPELYNPILEELEAFGIKFTETSH
ncbi:MAG: saccharopine dehydrogenase C-terminal domain-containing protein [Phototrophicaceae bacterium]